MMTPTPTTLSAENRVFRPHCLQITPTLTEWLCMVTLHLLQYESFQQVLQLLLLPQPPLHHEGSFITLAQGEKLNFWYFLWYYNLFFSIKLFHLNHAMIVVSPPRLNLTPSLQLWHCSQHNPRRAITIGCEQMIFPFLFWCYDLMCQLISYPPTTPWLISQPHTEYWDANFALPI